MNSPWDAWGQTAQKRIPGMPWNPDLQLVPVQDAAMQPPPESGGGSWWKWALIGAGVLGAMFLIGWAAPKLAGGRFVRKNPKLPEIGDLVAIGSIVFGSIAVAFPDPAPFAGPSTLVGLPFMLGGLYYFGIDAEKGARKKKKATKRNPKQLKSTKSVRTTNAALLRRIKKAVA